MYMGEITDYRFLETVEPEVIRRCYVVGDETLSNNVTPFNYITLCIEDIYYRTTMLILVRLLY